MSYYDPGAGPDSEMVDAANDSIQLRADLEAFIEDLRTISPYAYNDVIERLRQIMNGEVERAS